MKLAFYTLFILSLVGCATTSGIVETGPDSYMISKEAGSGFAGLGHMKTDSIKEAGSYCKDHGKFLQLTATNDIPGGIGVFPHSDIQFMCLDKDDSRLKSTVMVPISPAPADKIMGGK